MNYPVYFDNSACNYGGSRVWFRCPTDGCGRRAALLYSGKIFACRHCHNLVYESQRESSTDQKARKADKIRKLLGWQPGILNANGVKPPGMRWKTYERLCSEYDTLAQIALNGIAQKFSFLKRQSE